MEKLAKGMEVREIPQQQLYVAYGVAWKGDGQQDEVKNKMAVGSAFWGVISCPGGSLIFF